MGGGEVKDPDLELMDSATELDSRVVEELILTLPATFVNMFDVRTTESGTLSLSLFEHLGVEGRFGLRFRALLSMDSAKSLVIALGRAVVAIESREVLEAMGEAPAAGGFDG